MKAFIALLAILAWPASALADTSACWEELRFSAGQGWATATTTLRFSTIPSSQAALVTAAGGRDLLPGGESVGLLKAEFSAMRSRGELQIWFDPISGSALQSRRVGFGKESRLKSHRFLAGAVRRERRAPDAADALGTPETWPLKSASEIPLPPDVDGSAVITPLMLLSRAAALAMRPQPGKVDEVVFTDTQAYRVVLESRGEEAMNARFSLDRGHGQEAVNGMRSVRRVDLRPHLLGDKAEEEPFSLLELEGETALMIDRATGLPMQIRGNWLRVGTVTVNLSSARLRSNCP